MVACPRPFNGLSLFRKNTAILHHLTSLKCSAWPLGANPKKVRPKLLHSKVPFLRDAQEIHYSLVTMSNAIKHEGKSYSRSRCDVKDRNINKFQAVSIHCRMKASALPCVVDKQFGLSTLLKRTKSVQNSGISEDRTHDRGFGDTTP